MKDTTSPRDWPGARAIEHLDGEVSFEAVGFSYDGRRPALDGLADVGAVEADDALVGIEGAVQQAQGGGLARSRGADVLFARSIRENLQVGRPDATDAEMLDALERAQAGDLPWSLRSVAASRALVASSRISTGGFFRSARAIERLAGPTPPTPRCSTPSNAPRPATSWRASPTASTRWCGAGTRPRTRGCRCRRGG
jgi:hypothetical protein